MANLLQIQDAKKSFGPRVLFDRASFAVNDEEHIGVIGPNGAGKTTLFKILTGHESLDSGELIKSRSLRLGYLAQHDEWSPTESVEEFLNARCHTPLWELKTLGLGLGLTDEIFSRPISSLSGGYRMRVKLLSLVGQEPNLMLLDEPTNYLDLETLLVLENFLQDFKGAFLLISHDREFLRRTTDHILEIEAGDMTKFNGNIDDYFEQKDMLRAQLEARALSLKEKRQAVLDFVARFGAKASKAKQAQSRLKSLKRMETIEIKPVAVSARIHVPPPSRCGKQILELKDVSLGYPDKTVLRNVNFDISNGDHLAVVGMNGAGKTTFLKALAGGLKPLSGSLRLGFGVSLGYYAQHVSEALDPNSNVLDSMSENAHADVSRQEVLNMAGSLLFSGDDVHKKISMLSGGEKSRVALGRILLQKSPCLILDEPTNHLDFQTVEALTEALHEYEGTVIVVSHDRGFIRRIGTKILEIRKGEAHLYPGTYDDYVWSLQKGGLAARRESEAATPVASKVPARTSERPIDKEQKKLWVRELGQIERQMQSLEKKLQTQQAKLSELNAAAAPSLTVITEMGALQKDIDLFEEEWLSLGEKRDQLQGRLK